MHILIFLAFLELIRKSKIMETFRALHIEGHLFFVTATIVDWVRLLDKKLYRDIVLNSLKWLHTNDRMKLYAFVIMPNHLHFISKPANEFSIYQILQIFGSFTAHEFLKKLKIGIY
jgi:REP element-mobilizing transposase RayT